MNDPLSSSIASQITDRFSQAQEELVLQSADLSLRTLAGMVASGAIDTSPNFQRRDRWDAHRQSALIESFLLNMPVPPIYLAEDDLGTYAVIDGKQRITAISAFLGNDYALKGLDRFEEVSGLRYEQLPRLLQNALDLRPLRAVTLLRQSNPTYKFEVFRRLNSGGEILNAQEIRNVVYRGPLNDLVYRLSGAAFLRTQLKITSDRSPAFRNMQDAEYVLRFLTLDVAWESFSGDFSASMNWYMEENRFSADAHLIRLGERFEDALDRCERLWGKRAFKRPDGSGWRDQALAGMYDAQMVAVADLPEHTIRHLQADPGLAENVVRELFEDPRFDAAVRQGTNTPSRVKYRISRLTDALILAGH